MRDRRCPFAERRSKLTHAAGVVKLVDTQDLGSCAHGREGSSPFSGTPQDASDYVICRLATIPPRFRATYVQHRFGRRVPSAPTLRAPGGHWCRGTLQTRSSPRTFPPVRRALDAGIARRAPMPRRGGTPPQDCPASSPWVGAWSRSSLQVAIFAICGTACNNSPHPCPGWEAGRDRSQLRQHNPLVGQAAGLDSSPDEDAQVFTDVPGVDVHRGGDHALAQPERNELARLLTAPNDYGVVG